MNISYTHHRLENGLDVLIHEDHACPIVAVNLWYHVGSKDETPGRTGFAHLFEHLMFEGSEHYDHGYFQPLQEAGALLNGSTNADRTNYWEVVPRNALELALWMESDRMGYLLPALTDAKFENQREVVLNERRQNYENRPYGFAGMALVGALYAPDHPYRWMTIGSAEDIRAARLDDVRAFFQTYYRPRNASLALAGDVDTDQVLALAADCFGPLDGRRRASRGRVHPAAQDDVRVAAAPRGPRRAAAAVHRVALARAVCPGRRGAGSGGRAAGEREDVAPVSHARVRRADRHRDRGLAELPRDWRLLPDRGHGGAGADPRRSSSARSRARSSTFVAQGPTDLEMERCQAQAEANFVYRLQTVGGFGGKSDQLNAYNVFIGDPGFFQRDLDRYRRVTPGAMQRAAREWLRPDGRVALSVVPRGRVGLALGDSRSVAVS